MTITTTQDYKSLQGQVIKVTDAKTIPYKKLKKLGVKKLLIDYDGTITSNRKQLPGIEAEKLLEQLQQDFTIIILSNNWIHAKKRKEYFKTKNIEYKTSMKPIYGSRQETKAVMIGDKTLTDGLYAKKLRIPFYKVKKALDEE